MGRKNNLLNCVKTYLHLVLSLHNTISHITVGYQLLFSSSFFLFKERDFLSGCSLLCHNECKFYISEPLLGHGNGL